MKKSGAEPSTSSAEHTDHSPASQTVWSVAAFALRAGLSGEADHAPSLPHQAQNTSTTAQSLKRFGA